MLRTLAISIAVLCALAAPMDAQTAVTAGTLKQCLGHRVTVRAIRPDLAMVTFKDGIQARLPAQNGRYKDGDNRARWC